MQIVQKYKIDLYKKLIEIRQNFGPLRAQNYIIYNWKFIFIVYIQMQIVQKYKVDLFKKLNEILRAQNYVLYNWKLIFIVYIRMQIVQIYKMDLFKKLIEIWHNFGPVRAQNYIIFQSAFLNKSILYFWTICIPIYTIKMSF